MVDRNRHQTGQLTVKRVKLNKSNKKAGCSLQLSNLLINDLRRITDFIEEFQVF
jgi:hypothetical protein